MTDILTMQVWISRYKYKIFNYNAGGTTYVYAQEIDVTFEKGTSTTGEILCSDSISGTDGSASEVCKLKSDNSTCTDSICNNKTYTHLAFTFGEEELTGMWVGKFEISAPIDSECYENEMDSYCDVTGITPLVKPDVMSYRYAEVSTFETNMMAMNDSGNIYGFAETDDTHMMKNMEWGVVAYLSHSKYGTCTDGTCKEINVNNSSLFYTGRSGGSHEYVMGNIVYSDGITMMSGYDSANNSGYTGKVYDGSYASYTGVAYPENKYLDKYSFGTSNAQRIRMKLGDAVKELGRGSSTNWYSNEGYVAFRSSPWFTRGYYSRASSGVGVFTSEYSSGNPNDYVSARLVIS